MKQIQILFVLFLCLVFIAGAFVNLCGMPLTENMDNEASDDCPNLLIQKGNILLLYNTNKPTVDGVNPLPFFNLDEYINYLEIQRKNGNTCPVLYLQEENNAQGEDVYRMRPSPFDLQGGNPPNVPQQTNPVKVQDASRQDPPYNDDNYAGFDPTGQYIGVYTDVDTLHDSTQKNKISDNPMDPNWAGVVYTQQMIDSGKYDENAVTRPIYTQPKTSFQPSLPSIVPAPRDVL